MKATSEILAREIYKAWRHRVFATCYDIEREAAKKLIAQISATIEALVKLDWCERCGTELKGGICQNYGCEHDRILSDLDATE